MKAKTRDWKEIKGYEGLYTIADDSSVYSVRYGRCLKPQQARDNHFIVVLYDHKGERKVHSLGRLLALHFLPLPEGNIDDYEAHHIDFSTNVSLDNIEWRKRKFIQSKSVAANRKPGLMPSIYSYDKLGKKTEYPNVSIAAERLQKPIRHISLCSRGLLRFVDGIMFSRKDMNPEEALAERKERLTRKNSIIKCIDNGRTYDSLKSAAELLKISLSSLQKHLGGKLKRCGGYKFEYVEQSKRSKK